MQFRDSWWFEGSQKRSNPWVYIRWCLRCSLCCSLPCTFIELFPSLIESEPFFSVRTRSDFLLALSCCAANLRLPTAGIAMQSSKVRSFGTSGPQDSCRDKTHLRFWLQLASIGDAWLQGCETCGLVLSWVQHMWSYNDASHPEPCRFKQCQGPCRRAMGRNLIVGHLRRCAQALPSVSLLWIDLWVMSVLPHQDRLQTQAPWKRKCWHPKGQHLQDRQQQPVSMLLSWLEMVFHNSCLPRYRFEYVTMQSIGYHRLGFHIFPKK